MRAGRKGADIGQVFQQLLNACATVAQAFSLCLLAFPAFAAIEGTVINSTTGRPVAGVTVSLIQPGANGMQTLASSKSDANGAFSIDKELPPPPALLQADYKGVTYTQVQPPGRPTTGIKLEVYDATTKPPADLVPLHMFMLDSVSDTIDMTETFFVQNKSKLTFQDSVNGSIQFYPPKGAGEEFKVQIIPPTQMSIQRTAEKTKQPGLYKIDYPIKPGETEFDIHYTVPTSSGLSGKVIHSDPPMRILVPLSVKVTGDGISEQGSPPNIKATLYNMTGTSYNLKLDGTGTIRTPDNQDSQDKEDTGAPETKEIKPRIYERLAWVLGLTFAVLAVGGTLLFRKGTA